METASLINKLPARCASRFRQLHCILPVNHGYKHMCQLSGALKMVYWQHGKAVI